MTDTLFAVDPDARTISGLLLPFGELSRPSISGEEPVMFSAATELQLPADPMVATLYDDDHDRFAPRGRGASFEKTDAGIVATFAIARTPEGDALLTRAQQEPRPRLSAEIKGLVRRGQNAVRGVLTGASIVTKGAFESAALFAAVDAVTVEPTDGRVTFTPDDAGDIQVAATTIPETVTVEPDEGDPVVFTPEGTEPEANPEGALMADATVPATLTAPGAQKDTTTANGLFAAVAAVKNGNPDAAKAYAGGDALFAISNIQDSGPSSVTIGADVRVPNYVGELWKRRPYQRRFVPLVGHAELTSYQVIGWQWDDGKEPTTGDYAGNVGEIPSNAVDTKPVTATAARIAGGHAIDRRYTDFGDQGVIASYFRLMTEDVARKTDAKALAAIIAAATATTPGTVPSGVAKGLAAIVDGALDVIASENRPSFALVDAALWRDIVMTGKDEVLGYLNAGFGLEEGSVEGFKILPATVGTAGNAGKQVIVGATEALTFYELGGEAPIRVEGIDPHHGAFDPAVFAYWATITNNAAAVRVVTTA